MVDNIINLWEKHKGDLRHYIANTKQDKYGSYKKLVKLIIDKIINKTDDTCRFGKYDSSNITVIDDGDYRGTLIFLIPAKINQPSATEYLVTYADYGTCSACDTLKEITDMSSYNEMPSKEQVDGYMTLCLHLIQRMKPLYEK